MLKLKNVSFGYDDEEPVLRNINFQVERGEHFSIIGESGCGKSTLLQLIYGLHHTEGEIYWGERELLGPNYNLVPGEEVIKYLAQNFDLMLPLNVADNVGKYLSNMYPRKKKQRIYELLEVVEMEDLGHKRARDLSGGQQQRVALARALAKEPEILLLDEPFSHIDHFRKNNLRRKVYSYLKEKGITAITATHDSTDALSFADNTMVLKSGNIHSLAPPQDLYFNPPDKYVASLFGEINDIFIKDVLPAQKGRKKVLLYPHEIKISEQSAIKAQVIKSFFKGENYLIKATLKEQIIFFNHFSEIAEGEEVFIEISQDLIRSRSSR